jgi:hypothetical protein
MASVEALASFDWSKEYRLDQEAGAKLKSSIEAAARLKRLHREIDGQLRGACGDLAADLGSASEVESGEEACQLAIGAVAEAKTKLGGKAKLALNVDAPSCGASLESLQDCATKCAASVKGGEVKAKCEGGKVSGTCTAQCEGQCELEAAAQCDGTCMGKCDAKIKGECYGKCRGKCNGKATSKGGGKCDGTCDGKCDARMTGECKGECEGSCQAKASAHCAGTCSGTCSTEIQEPKCSGEVKLPKVDAECAAKCQMIAASELECSPPRVMVRVVGAADAKYAARFETAMANHLPAIIEVAASFADTAPQLASSVTAVAEGGVELAEQLEGKASGDAQATALAGQLAACVVEPFKAAIDAAAGFEANAKASVEVKASVETKGSAEGSAEGDAAKQKK